MPRKPKTPRAQLPPAKLATMRAQERAAYARRAEHHRARHAAYYVKNRDAVLAQKAARRKGPEGEVMRERDRSYQERRYAECEWVRAAAKANVRAWRKANPIKRREEAQRRQARKRTRAERIDYVQVWKESDGRCGICGCDIKVYDQIHFDHVVPLARGGTHTRDNIQVAHAVCNMKKQDKLQTEIANAA